MATEQIAESVSGRPHPLLRRLVAGYSGYHFRGFPAGEHMGLPSRHLTFIVQFDAPLELAVPTGDGASAVAATSDGRRPGGAAVRRFDALVGGLHTSPAVIRHDGTQHGVQLHVTPAGARALLGLPAGVLAADVVPLDAIWGAAAHELRERLATAPSWAARFAVLDHALLRAAAGRAETPSRLRPETLEAWRRLLATDGRIDVGTLAAQVGWSRRHLSAQFAAEFGVGPKELARVLRFERSKWLFLRPDRPSLATIAAECGYADQAHMARDWRALAGASPTRWLAAEELPLGHTERVESAA